jgi:uncharacterized membrane protein YfcA
MSFKHFDFKMCVLSIIVLSAMFLTYYYFREGDFSWSNMLIIIVVSIYTSIKRKEDEK